MANKKITVVGDGAEQPMTPEEEHRIEVKIDQMLDPSVPDVPETQAKPAAPVESKVIDTHSALKPKVTKIVTTFADEDDAVVNTPKPAPVRPDTTPKVHKPVKKISISHHDEDDSEPESTVADTKEATPKASSTKTRKNLSAVHADELTEVDDLAAKADAITALALEAEEMMGAKQPVRSMADEAVKDSQADVLDHATTDTHQHPAAIEPMDVDIVEDEDELPDTTDDQSAGAPPLILKHSAAPIDTAEDTPEPLIASKLVQPPTVPDTDITIDESGRLVTADHVQPSASSTPDADSIQPPKLSDSAQPQSLASADAKRYRPPEGPMQFKRADVPLQPHKPGEPRSADMSANELSEDEALTRAFETPKPIVKGTTASRKKKGGLKKLLGWFVLIVLFAAVATVAAVPSLRTKALGLVGLDDSPKPAATVQTGTPVSTTPATTTAMSADDIYVARRAGIYNVYQAKTGGQQEQLLLAGTGNEDSESVLAPNADNTQVALVSIRDGKKGTDGDLQKSLTLIAVGEQKAVAIDTADQVRLVDWFGTKLVYVLVSSSTSTTDVNRYQIISYDTATKKRVVMDRANYLNDVLSAKGGIYYATGSSYSAAGQFVSIKPDATGKQVLLTAEIAAISRTDYDNVTLSGANKWYNYRLGDSKAVMTNAVGQTAGRLYVDSPDGKSSAYLNAVTDATRLIVLNKSTGKETTIPVTDAKYPIRWLSNDTIVLRSGEADYTVKSSGSTPTKYVDVSDVAGISLWRQ